MTDRVCDNQQTGGGPTTVTFGKRLEQLRKLAGLSPNQLAEKAGITTAAVHYLEAERFAPKLATASRLVKALGCSLSAFDDCEPAESAEGGRR
jgi:transcriptional regulator with XRE-family HTH domain